MSATVVPCGVLCWPVVGQRLGPVGGEDAALDGVNFLPCLAELLFQQGTLDAAVDDADARRPRRWRAGRAAARSGVSRAKTSSKTSRAWRRVASQPRLPGAGRPRRAGRARSSTRRDAVAPPRPGRAAAPARGPPRPAAASRPRRRRRSARSESRCAAGPARPAAAGLRPRRCACRSGSPTSLRWPPARPPRRRRAPGASAAPPALPQQLRRRSRPPPRASCRSPSVKPAAVCLSNSSSTTCTPGATLSGAASSERRPRSNGCSSQRRPRRAVQVAPSRTAPAG